MPAFWIVEHFDVIEHVLTGLDASFVSLSSDPLGLEQMEEAFRDGVIITIATSAHAGLVATTLPKNYQLLEQA